MADISVLEQVPGIRNLVMFRPESEQHLHAQAKVLLRENRRLLKQNKEFTAADKLE